MKRVYERLCILICCLLPVAAGFRLWYDLSHPELWDRDPMNDPRLYGPLWAGLVAFLLFWAWQVYRSSERRKVWLYQANDKTNREFLASHEVMVKARRR